MDNDLTKLLLGLDQYEIHKEEVREDYKKMPWSMPGGKFKSLHKILPELPYSNVWVEGCIGTGVVTMNRRESPLEILNDRHAGIISFYRCIRDADLYDRLLDRLRTVVYSREEFIWCRDTWDNCEDDVERAARWYYMIRTSFNQIGRNFGRSLQGEAMLPKKYWNGLRLFPHIHHRIRNSQLENMDVVQVLKDYDSIHTVGYFDPDYVETDQGIYQHGVDHVKLLDAVMDSRGFYAISGYHSSLYDQYKWDRIKEWKSASSVKAQTNTETGHLKGRPMERGDVTEVLYIKEWR